MARLGGLITVCSMLIAIVCPATALIRPESLAAVDISQLEKTRLTMGGLPVHSQCEHLWLEVFVETMSYLDIEPKQHYSLRMMQDDMVTIYNWLELSKQLELAQFARICWTKLKERNIKAEEQQVLQLTAKTVVALPKVLATTAKLSWPSACAHFWYAVTKTYYSSQLKFERGSPLNVEEMKFFAKFLRDLKKPELTMIADHLGQCARVDWSQRSNGFRGYGGSRAASFDYAETDALSVSPKASFSSSSGSSSSLISGLGSSATSSRGYPTETGILDHNYKSPQFEPPGEWVASLVERSLLEKLDWTSMLEIVRSISEPTRGGSLESRCVAFWARYMNQIKRDHLLRSGHDTRPNAERVSELDSIDTHLLTQLFEWLVGAPQREPIRELATFVGQCIAHVQDQRLVRVQHLLHGKISLTEDIAHNKLTRLDGHKLGLSQVEQLVRRQSKMARLLAELAKIVADLNSVLLD